MICSELKNYLSTAKGVPFFYITGDEEYKSTLEELRLTGLGIIRMSSFCSKDDKFPDLDAFVDSLRTNDVNYRNNKVVIVGLGEFLALKGSEFASDVLRRLKNTTIGNTRAVILLRGISLQAIEFVKEDVRMFEQQRAFISTNRSSDISVTNVTMGDTNLVSNKGIRYLLEAFEDGACGNVCTNTALLSDNSIIPVTTFSSAYDMIKLRIAEMKVTKELGTEKNWQKLQKDLSKCGYDLNVVFSGYNIDGSIFDILYDAVSGLEYKNWLVFLYFKQNVDSISNSYMSKVIDTTTHYEDLKNNLLTLIINYKHTDVEFTKLYKERKQLLKEFPEEDVAVFVKENESDYTESIYRFTDNTLLERKCVIKWISNHGMTDAISYVYPALDHYLKKYTFDCPFMSKELTEYFDIYKRLKVENRIDDKDFLNLVEKYGKDFSYTQLKTRNNAIKGISNKENSFLYWIDALGVEYLSYITQLAAEKGLSIHIDITRCELPTITECNKAFYYNHWSGKNKYKEEALDDIKHNEKGGYFFKNDETGNGDAEPLHLAAELNVIESAIRKAAYELAMHNCKSFVIASDHGASRLAVIKKQDVPYDTDTKGEHSGRCCRYFEGCTVENKVVERIEDDEYIVLTDYGRFRKSRMANVEVHGGASLEEIVVPVITLTLKQHTNVQIRILNPNGITADRHNGVTLTVYISDVESQDDISIVWENNRYIGTTTDGSNFVFELNDIKRPKNKPYTADVFDADNLIGSITFSVMGKAAEIKDDFDFDNDD